MMGPSENKQKTMYKTVLKISIGEEILSWGEGVHLRLNWNRKKQRKYKY